MTINLGNLKIWCTKRRDHKNYLWRTIYELRQEIIDEILISTKNDTHLDEPELRRKAVLIRKYSRRLKNMSY